MALQALETLATELDGVILGFEGMFCWSDPDCVVLLCCWLGSLGGLNGVCRWKRPSEVMRGDVRMIADKVDPLNIKQVNLVSKL